MGNKKRGRPNKDLEALKRETNKKIPDAVVDKETGKVYKKGKDYEIDFQREINCKCETLKKLGYGHYICPNCKKIFEIPFTMQYSYEDILQKFDGILKNARTYFKPKSKTKKA